MLQNKKIEFATWSRTYILYDQDRKGDKTMSAAAKTERVQVQLALTHYWGRKQKDKTCQLCKYWTCASWPWIPDATVMKGNTQQKVKFWKKNLTQQNER
jgi:hypothetical protein